MNTNQTTRSLLKELQEIPTVPFLTNPISNYIEAFLKKNGYEYVNDNYSVITRLPNIGQPKLVIMVHTDHPGIILKSNKSGIIVGSVGINRLKKILVRKVINLKIFSPKGKYLGRGSLAVITKAREVTIKANFFVPTNSFAQYDIDYFKEDNNSFSVYNADDAAPLAALLSILSQSIKPKFDTYIVFNLHEEVHQISSWHLAKNNTIGITGTDIVLNLECLRLKNIHPKKYTKATYNGGVVLQLSNIGCLFGYKSKEENLAEKLVRQVSHVNRIKIQTGIIKDSCDSRPISYFNLTPNIVTLTIPNKYKHNKDSNGSVVSEVILKKDINDFHKLLKHIINASPSSLNKVDGIKNLSKTLREKDDVTDHKLMKSKALLNERLETYYKFIVQRRYFYPTDIKDAVYDFVSKCSLYLNYFRQKLWIT